MWDYLYGTRRAGWKISFASQEKYWPFIGRISACATVLGTENLIFYHKLQIGEIKILIIRRLCRNPERLLSRINCMLPFSSPNGAQFSHSAPASPAKVLDMYNEPPPPVV